MIHDAITEAGLVKYISDDGQFCWGNDMGVRAGKVRIEFECVVTEKDKSGEPRAYEMRATACFSSGPYESAVVPITRSAVLAAHLDHSIDRFSEYLRGKALGTLSAKLCSQNAAQFPDEWGPEACKRKVEAIYEREKRRLHREFVAKTFGENGEGDE